MSAGRAGTSAVRRTRQSWAGALAKETTVPAAASLAAKPRWGRRLAAVLALALLAAAASLLLPAVRSRLWREPQAPQETHGPTVSTKITVAPSTKIVVAEKTATGELKVLAEPPGAALFLDGAQQGSVKPDIDLCLSNVPVGPHRVRIAMEDYESEEKSIEVKRDAPAVVRLRARPLPRLTVAALWAAAKAGDRPKMEACFAADALARLREADGFIAQNAASLPDALKGATALARLTAAAQKSPATPQVAPESVQGDRAAADVAWPWGKEQVAFAREADVWKIALPLPLADRLKSETEEALRLKKKADDEAAAVAEAKEAEAIRDAQLKALAGQTEEKHLPLLAKALVRAKDAAELQIAEKAALAAAEHLKAPDKAAGPLLAALPSAGAAARAALLRTLARLGGSKAIEALHAALKDEDAAVRGAAAKALADAALAEAQQLLAAKRYADAQAACRKALALPGYAADARAQEALKAATAGAEAEAARTRFDQALAAARAALARGDHEALAREIQAARLALPNAAVPQALLAALEPSLTVIAEVGGTEFKGAQITLNGIPQNPTPAGFWLKKGKTYAIEVTIPPQGERRFTKASKTLTADWQGPQTWRAALAEEARPKVQVYKEWPFDAAEAKRRQEATARALGVKIEEEVDLGGGVKLTLVLIPAGEFLMGSAETSEELVRMFREDNPPTSWFDAEHPQHRVRITKPFWMGKHEVMQEQWEAIMGNNPSMFKGAKNPVESVSWNDVQGFLQKLNGRAGGGGFAVPTEAQWEYACRAGTGTQFGFGDDAGALGEYAWHPGNSANTPHAGGGKRPNAWGLHDLHGNVWEWCSDWFDERYYAASPLEDPQGSQGGQSRVLRGGSWTSAPWDLRSALRSRHHPDLRSLNLGFRVVRAAAGP